MSAYASRLPYFDFGGRIEIPDRGVAYVLHCTRKGCLKWFILPELHPGESRPCPLCFKASRHPGDDPKPIEL